MSSPSLCAKARIHARYCAVSGTSDAIPMNCCPPRLNRLPTTYGTAVITRPITPTMAGKCHARAATRERGRASVSRTDITGLHLAPEREPLWPYAGVCQPQTGECEEC